MHRLWNKSIGLLCALALGLSAFSPGTAAADTSAAISSLQIIHNSVSTASGDGYVSAIVSIGSSVTQGSVKAYKSSSIPSSYDLRGKNKLTAVRDQGTVNDCWAFAAYGSLESYLMPAESDDFSEDLLNADSGFDLGTDGGGNDVMATAYLARWDGPAVQGAATSTAQKHVQNVDWLTGRTGSSTPASVDNAIKSAVMQYGAVFAPLYYDDSGNTGTSSYYNAATHSYYYSGGSTDANHAIDIVGWDDTYAASNFTNTPTRNGAFLCRNSWGNNWGDGGYFYVSYDDTVLGSGQCSVFDSAESTNNYTYNYQYDPLGVTASTALTGASNNWMANIFTAQSDDPLTAAAFYTLAAGVGYNVYVASVNSSGTPSSSAAKVASGTMTNAGYHTVSFNNTVSLSKGQKFAVEVELLGSDTEIAVETPVSGYSADASASAGQSFISADGSSWSDMTRIRGGNNTNVCLKAFTKAASNLPSVTISSPTNGSVCHGNLTVSGTATAAAGLSSIQIRADGTLLQALSASGTSQAFQYTIPAGTLSYGAHTVSVTAVDVNNLSAAQSVTISNTALAAMTTIDTPADGGTLTGQTVQISGWALNTSGINRVDIYVYDSGDKVHSLGSVPAKSLNVRTDVSSAFPDYNTLDSGYSFSADTSALPAGSYMLAVAGIGNDGSVQWATRTINIGPSPLTAIDVPAANATVNGSSITVSGWALNRSGIQRVDMYLYDSGDKVHALTSVSASAMYTRTDVSRAYPAYAMANSGYSATASLAGFAAGTYMLAVAGIGNDGSVQWATRTINIGPSPLTAIDVPAANATVNGSSITVSGWALNHSGIQRVDMYLYDSGDKVHALASVSASAMYRRTDVSNTFPAYAMANSGYSATASLADFAVGTYMLAVAGIGNDGDVQWATVSIRIS